MNANFVTVKMRQQPDQSSNSLTLFSGVGDKMRSKKRNTKQAPTLMTLTVK